MAELVEEEEINAQGPARMSAVDDGLTTFRNQSFLFGGWIWYGNEWKSDSDNIPRVRAAIDLVVVNIMEKEVFFVVVDVKKY